MQKANTGDANYKFAYAGIALTTVAAGEICSLITGVGVVLNINCADVGAGIAMMMGTTDGRLLTATNAAAAAKAQAVTLENNAAAGLTKCQTL